jgi:hypothetical protein
MPLKQARTLSPNLAGDPLHPAAYLLAKLARVIVRADDAVSSASDTDDTDALRLAINDLDVRDWINGMLSRESALLIRHRHHR